MRVSDARLILSATWGHLRRRPGSFAWIAGIGSLLGTLAAALQVFAHLSDTPIVQLSLTLATKLPLVLYFFPRYLLRADAETLDRRENPCNAWSTTFDQRWWNVLVGRLLLYSAIMIGLSFCILPGIWIWIAFGWVPLRMLLRGDKVLPAAQNSYAFTRQFWIRLLPSLLILGGLYLALLFPIAWALQALAPDPTPWMRLRLPAFWIGHALGTALDLGLSVGCLAIYQRFELEFDPRASDQEEPSSLR